MGLIDRYIFGLFLRVFFVCVICLTGIYVVGDFVGNLNEFLDVAEQKGSLGTILLAFYGARVPWFFDLTGRIAALIAAVFAVTWLQRHNEMTALMAAGISRWRIVRPLLVGVILVAVLGTLNREIVLPRLRDALSRNVRDLKGDQRRPLVAQYDHLSDILIDGREVSVTERTIDQPLLRLPLRMQHFSHELRAKRAVRLDATTDHPAGFLLQQVTTPADIDEKPSLHHEGRPLVYTRRDAAWLQPGECFVVSQVDFGQLADGRYWRQFASTADLIGALKNPSLNLGGDAHVTVHARIVQPLLDIALVFLGLPVVLAKESRNVFVSAGSCLLIVTVFMLVLITSHALGSTYLIPPARAAWLPLMLVVPWAVWMSEPLRR